MKSPRADCIRELADKFPTAGDNTLAKKAYSENPRLWPSFKACYSCTQRVRGHAGKKGRRNLKSSSEYFNPITNNTDPGFGWIPEPKSEWDAEWTAVQFDAGRYGIIADLHIPWHRKGPITRALKEIKERNPTHLIINGDLSDFYSVSRHEKDPRRRVFVDEIKATREFLVGLRAEFKNAEIVWKIGNHEERWEWYLWNKCREICDLDLFSYEEVFKTDDLGIKVIGEKRPLRLGILNVIHGHEYSFPIANPVNPARGLFNRAKTQALCCHHHQPSSHSETTLDGMAISTWSVGCLCDLHPRYRPLNNWLHGFAFVDVEKDGNFECNNYKILGDNVYPA